MDPYAVLGVSPNASDDEIKKKYRELVKKYHPDKYAGTDMEDLANEKMQQVNDAYDSIMKMRKGGSTGGSGSQYRGGSSYGGGSGYYRAETGYGEPSDVYDKIKRHINNGNIYEAESLLNTLAVKDDKYYFLYGLIAWRKNWYDEARSSLQMAVSLNPGNPEYRNALNQLNMAYNSRRAYNNAQYQANGQACNADCCSICGTLWCLDSCCECGGGDLISCC